MKKAALISAVTLILFAIGFLIRSGDRSLGPNTMGNTLIVAPIALSGTTTVSKTTLPPGARDIRWRNPTNLSPDSKFVVPGLKVNDPTIVGTIPTSSTTNAVAPGK